MGKFKKITMTFMLSLCAFLMAGRVNAAASANNFDIVCDPQSVEKGNTATCHLVAQINGDTGIFGVVAKVTEMKHLRLYTGDGSTGVHGASNNVVGEYLKNGQSSSVVTAYSCVTTGSTVSDPFCALFMSKNGTNQILPTTGTSISGLKKGNNEYKNYTDIGYFTVELDETATKEDCGRLCVSVQYGETSAAFTSNDLSAGTTGTAACDEITPLLTESLGVKETPETGNFASYAVLIAGAFIAISAIAIAKKHNKFYRV